ncbi:AAA family ATPase [Blastococcus sp. BMG 814]|uniref:Nuclease SbcCD subunit C n=1 Tax=Blastococcus carthaginiensis TaxID=3050034 RepID=A0ABT9IFQ5_9ACTN|nr:AAA family ATPase [Blastococcus carthaginiensis]MDP5184398.1 AAA family ATPase [Blastococcus carthaginiensis]
MRRTSVSETQEPVATGDPLQQRLSDRVEESELSDDAKLIVLSAYWGDEELRAALDGAVRGEQPEAPRPDAAEVPRTYLKSVTVTGFRGVGPEATLELQAGPGLTLVVGRNGSGKSSFAEAAEIALTGVNARWASRSSVWKESWRNLHLPEAAPSVRVQLSVDGEPQATSVVREWDGEDVTDSRVWVQRHGARREYGELGWTEALTTYRPFLSYSELGSLLGRPSDLYDALYRILGLQRVADAQDRLHVAFTELDGRRKAAAEQCKILRTAAGEIEDERAALVTAALTGRKPDLDAIAEVLRADASPTGDLAALRAWATLAAPDTAAAAEAADALEAAAAANDQLAGGDSDQARRLAALLERALDHADHADATDCPVCGTADQLDDAWRVATGEHLGRLRQAAVDADQAQADLRAARASAATAAPTAPALLTAPAPEGIAGAAVHAQWRAWAEGARSDDLAVSAAALRIGTPELARAVTEAVSTAAAELRRREDFWQPLAERLREYLALARTVAGEAAVLADVKAARQWLRSQADALRDEGLAPIAARAADIWDRLRQESNIDLGPVRLKGTRTQRHVAVDVTVDGDASAALGVMSQGELHALGLALFLPRAMLEPSPFGFLVIDDPVQAMDPTKVDGLARVLADAARTHQVVVFTHDDRLPEAVRRLQLPATVWEVLRRERSLVELRKCVDPVARHLDDARAVARTEDLPPTVRARVVAGFCRSALEATCHEIVRARRLGRGDPHADVEAAISAAETLTRTAALALLDDADRGGEVLRVYNERHGRWAGDVHLACNRGAHGGAAVDPVALVNDTRRLAGELRRRFGIGAAR